MKHPLIRQGEGPAAAYHRITTEREQEQRRLNKIINDITDLPPAATGRGRRLTAIASRSPAGDEQRLRGIPAIGRGVTGAIPGTKPGP